MIEEVGCSDPRNCQGNFSLLVFRQENWFSQFQATLFALVEKHFKVAFLCVVINSHRYVEEYFLCETSVRLGMAAQEVHFDKVHIVFWHYKQSVAKADEFSATNSNQIASV